MATVDRSCQHLMRTVCQNLIGLPILAALLTLAWAQTSYAQHGGSKNRMFDAVGGGAASAMSFGQGGGVAWRIYPAGAKPGYEAAARFQSYRVSPLVRRMEGMEGSIWGQNLWTAQKNADARKQRQAGKQIRENSRDAAHAPLVASPDNRISADIASRRRSSGRVRAKQPAAARPSAGQAWWDNDRDTPSQR